MKFDAFQYYEISNFWKDVCNVCIYMLIVIENALWKIQQITSILVVRWGNIMQIFSPG